jgi:hypothetical protein
MIGICIIKQTGMISNDELTVDVYLSRKVKGKKLCKMFALKSSLTCYLVLATGTAQTVTFGVHKSALEYQVARPRLECLENVK